MKPRHQGRTHHQRSVSSFFGGTTQDMCAWCCGPVAGLERGGRVLHTWETTYRGGGRAVSEWKNEKKMKSLLLLPPSLVLPLTHAQPSCVATSVSRSSSDTGSMQMRQYRSSSPDDPCRSLSFSPPPTLSPVIIRIGKRSRREEVILTLFEVGVLSVHVGCSLLLFYTHTFVSAQIKRYE